MVAMLRARTTAVNRAGRERGDMVAAVVRPVGSLAGARIGRGQPGVRILEQLLQPGPVGGTLLEGLGVPQAAGDTEIVPPVDVDGPRELVLARVRHRVDDVVAEPQRLTCPQLPTP